MEGIESEDIDLDTDRTMAKWRAGRFSCKPPYGRKFFWSRKMSSLLIETILLGKYVPPIVVNRTSTGTDVSDVYDEIIDGQQRCTTLFTFIEGLDPWNDNPKKAWSLTGLVVMSELNGLSFQDLNDEQQRCLRNFEWRACLYKAASKEACVGTYCLLNQRATPRSDQDVRNALYDGPVIRWLRTLGENPEFLSFIGDTQYTTERAGEHILRFLAFYRNGVGSYIEMWSSHRPILRAFVDDEMRYWQDNFTEEAGALIGETFSRAVNLARQVLGDIGFSKTGSKKGLISAIGFDLVTCGFALYSADAVLEKRTEIRQRFLDLCAADPDSQLGKEKSLWSAQRVMARYKKWGEALDEILGADARLPATIIDNPVSLIPSPTVEVGSKKLKRRKPSMRFNVV